MTLRRAAIALTVILALWLGGYAAFALSVITARAAPLTQYSEAAVVLTGAPGRVGTGVQLVQAGLAPRLFISGVHPDATKDDILAQHGAADIAGHVTLGRSARTTRENAAEVGAWLRGRPRAPHSLRLVTSTYHMPRARMEMAAALPEGVEVRPHPIPDPRFEGNAWALTVLMWKEYHKTLWRWAQIRAGL